MTIDMVEIMTSCEDLCGIKQERWLLKGQNMEKSGRTGRVVYIERKEGKYLDGVGPLEASILRWCDPTLPRSH